VAGIQQLHDKSCSFIFATHLHEITGYEEIKKMDKLALKHMKVVYNREMDLLIYDRKLCDGPGDNMYGLEVCKSLNLPDDFLELANNIRMKYNPESSSILSLKTSHFNRKKLMGKCERCGYNIGNEVHHLQHQSCANEDGIIQTKDGEIFHKNHSANLMTLCEMCHDKIHKEGKMHKKVKTNKGYTVMEI
jgi:DNA mismatch repair protein MutS